jgi:hypothetical protein
MGLLPMAVHRQPNLEHSSGEEDITDGEPAAPKTLSPPNQKRRTRRSPGAQTPPPRTSLPRQHFLVRFLTGRALLEVLLALYITFTFHYFYSHGTLNPSGCLEMVSSSAGELQYMHNQARPVLMHNNRKYQVGSRWSDPRTTVAACNNHWARGIEKEAREKLKSMKIFFSLNLRNNDAGKRANAVPCEVRLPFSLVQKSLQSYRISAPFLLDTAKPHCL